jgi:hypothetical protein
MNEIHRRRLAGQPISMAIPQDRRRAVEHYQNMAREAEQIRQAREARTQAAKDTITDALIRCERAYHRMIVHGRPADAAEYDAAREEFMDAVQEILASPQQFTQEHV